MSKNNGTLKYVIIANVIILLFFFINYSTIYEKDYFVDEAITFNIVNTLSFKTILSGIDVHPPLFYTLYKIIPHISIELLRFYSLILMCVSLSLLFFFTYKLFDKKTAFIVLVICSLSQTISYHGTYARMYSIIFFLSILLFYFTLTYRYKTSITLLIIMLLTHYYCIFLMIPLSVFFFIKKKKKYIKYMFICVFLTLLILIPYVHHQLTDNPYKLPPPYGRVSLISVPSMLIFPFIIPSFVTTTTMLIYVFVVIITILFLLTTFKHKKKDYHYFFLMSFITMILIFGLSFFSPYHHRYTMMLFPMIYVMLSYSLTQQKKLIKYLISTLFLICFLITFTSFQMNPNNQFIKLSESISCPKNILHETPFSLLPMRLYLPECEHYMAVSPDWIGMTNDTLYTAEHYINNNNIRYDIYIHYFDELKGQLLLENTDFTTMELILIE